MRPAFLHEHIQAYLRASLMPCLIMLAYSLYLTPWQLPVLGDGMNFTSNLNIIPGEILFPIVAAGWFRYAASGEMPGWFPNDWLRIARTLIATFVHVLLAALPVTAVIFVISFIYDFPSQLHLQGGEARIVASMLLPALLLSCFVGLRLLTLIPAAAAGSPETPRQSWRRMRGQVWLAAFRIFLVMVFTLMALAALVMPVEYSAMRNGWLGWPVVIWNAFVGWVMGGCMLLSWAELVRDSSKRAPQPHVS